MLELWIFINAVIALPALILEAVLGYPSWLHKRIPHPVVWAGACITAFERWWNKPTYSFATRRLLGCIAVLVLMGLAISFGWGVRWAQDVASVNDSAQIGALLAVVLVATVGLAQRSLFEHVRNVLTALRADDLQAARARVSLIVGRDTQRLDASGVSAAALESLAESFNDGIVAPAFWLVLGGLPGLFVYKVLNTADSLIGHKEERWRAFGWAAARADDVVNLVPARIAGALLVCAGLRGLRVMLKDASKHASPNAGWPEAAMAGALGVRLGGATTYDGVLHERPVFGTGPVPGVSDLGRGLRIYVTACGLLWIIVAAALVSSFFFLER